MGFPGRMERFGHFVHGWSEPFRHDEETVNVAEEDAVLPPAIYRKRILHRRQITAENVFFFDGLNSEAK